MAFKELKNEAGVSLGYLQTDNYERFGVHNLLHVQDQKAPGTNGGTFTAGAWRTRDLNSVITNNISGASLASNQITLPAGTYYFEGSSPVITNGALVRNNRARLYNVTNLKELFIGKSIPVSSANSSSWVSSAYIFSSHFTLTSESLIELQHQCSVSYDYGFGLSTSIGSFETYSDLKIWKVA